MITLQIPQETWDTAKEYWCEITKNKAIKSESSMIKFNFLDKEIFKNEKIETFNLDTIPSVAIMTELLNEIEDDIEAAKTGGVMDEDAVHTKENLQLTEYVCGPCFVSDKENTNTDQSFLCFDFFGLCFAFFGMRPLYHQSDRREKPEKETEKETEKEKRRESKIIPSAKSIEDTCDLFLKQTFFAKYFLLCLGINVIDPITNSTKEECGLTRQRDPKIFDGNYKFMSDELYVNCSDFIGLTLEDTNGINIAQGIYDATMKLLSSKMPISDEFLILCWQYVQIKSNTNYASGGDNSDSVKEFIEALLSYVRECLTVEEDTRDYFYFQQFLQLLHNNIWFVKDYTNNKLLFDRLNNLANQLLIEHKKCIWTSIQKAQKENKQDWNNLLNLDISPTDGVDSTDAAVLRQDKISNGIKPLRTEKDVNMITTALEEKIFGGKNYAYGLHRLNQTKTFDLISECNDKIYLPRCISFAVENNVYFQSQMQDVFGSGSGKYQSGTVKSYDRCLIKSNTDYSNESFPRGACILDFLRCSVTYKNVSHLLENINQFVKKIHNSEIKCISKILGVKNGFKDFLTWNRGGNNYLNDCQYIDIKFYLLFTGQHYTGSMIVEVQFLLDFLNNAKKMGHKYYTIKQKQLYINSIENVIYKNNNNCETYSAKIMTIINDSDIDRLSKELFYLPNIVFSMKTRRGRPILWHVEEKKNSKMFNLFLNFLFHFSKTLLSERDVNNIATLYSKDLNPNRGGDAEIALKIDSNYKLYLEKYFNFETDALINLLDIPDDVWSHL